MNIFEALRQSHELQRDLASQILKTSGESSERENLFDNYKTVLTAHATAEERHFYIPIMDDDSGVEAARHAIAEHHEIDELIEQMEDTEPSSPSWLSLARKLTDKVHHHLEEEEQRFFQMAGKILSEKQKTALVKPYLEEYQKGLKA
ncbi:hemerythrin domain-containing protein [Pusillimonas noertemannii]|uniref:Hemerythrin HHE cation binding domain-containing protein n=1 Tax=Pusillimonas noertemannii TaxID=305977 RepID=A0A2U1CKA2_9BURK|nr:hemerythrin domain-containing protein [Pusillimonas noertemannii]NYT69654.1 hemerythrin domain-containing protein [Pusillimonas noertemannii]PVY61422.1 hemerythrin HHE cation binding domain-containing protein [Pusillimonas noertemannii]TFL08978.1 hemerythrin domain-containing protein [Pusillimonas noertemannii]